MVSWPNLHSWRCQPLPMRSVMWPSKACFRDEDIDNAQRAPCATGIAVPPSFVPARQVRGSPGLPHLMSHVHHVGAASARGIAEEASDLSRQARLARLMVVAFGTTLATQRPTFPFP